MSTARNLALSVVCTLLWTHLIEGQDLSRYREFQFGMSLPAVAKKAGVKPSDAKAVHQRPAIIQELQWRPQHFLSASPQSDPLKDVLFSFYNGELFRMVVNYDPDKTQGLTNDDLVRAMSATYGIATRPSAKTISFSSAQGYSETEKILARWEDAQYSFNLFRSSYQPNFGMIVFSKQMDALARLAIVNSIRLDQQEAPQRDVERQQKEDRENRASEEKARLANKDNFRP
ncbi:MAG: hypothetical protein ACRD2L_14150 [Terriglobia bacterium]